MPRKSKIRPFAQEIRSRYLAGEKVESIANSFGLVTIVPIYVLLKETGTPKFLRKFTTDEIKNIVEDYSNGMLKSELSRKYNCDASAITYQLKKQIPGFKPNFKRPSLTRKEEDEIIKRYKSNEISDDIADDINIAQNTVYRVLARNGIELKNKKHSCNHSFFNQIDSPLKSYWMGYLFADGCVYRRKKSKCFILKLSIKSGDREYLEIFLRDINSDAQILERRGDKGLSAHIHSFELCQDLIKWGCTERKSLTKIFPKDVPFKEAFIVGYFDGNGFLCKKQISFCSGSENFLKELLVTLQGIGIAEKTVVRSQRCKNGHRITFSSKRDREKFKNLYLSSPRQMDRKLKLILDIV